MGTIVRISGPVVIAEGVENAKMFDVVRVGELGLVGEIIRIVGDKSTIQVYEDTSGIRPGEKVENTDRPLSVDLGPGLLTSIYDGIQRLLDVIREKTGDFIQRGFTASPLNEEKEWDFVPTVKKGDNVVEGQFIGKVPETGIIEHRVMVPFGLSGKIEEIKEGKFKVSDTIAVLNTGSQKVNIRLKQEWPVRISRRVQRKLPPELPLITGQRVIDTFFPVAKGGTVAVPGPFGSGKCVAGDTPILLRSGKQVPIRQLFDEAIGTSDYQGRPSEEYIVLPEDLEIFSYQNSGIVESKSKVIYRGKSDSLVSLTTKNGRSVRVTPIHKIFTFGSEGKLIEKEAQYLKVGELIASIEISELTGTIADETISSNGGDELNGIPQLLAQSIGNVIKDEIESIEFQMGPYDVYDLSVPDYGMNFVGGFGGIILHNTVVQHQLSKWADSDIVVYVGCGERGNEMTEILTSFPELTDPKSGKPLMERTVLIANTSNMPVAAREASIYTGITIAEYYRDMGYNVALMADSTSRWAEALREISGRLEEMPGEEGYPAYLGRRLSEFYERSGNAIVVSDDQRNGSITIVGAVSPPGGDISEPVSQNTLRVTRVFWALDSSLASRRHFPSINWLNSYSLYQGDLRQWFVDNVSKDWGDIYDEAMGILQKESELQEVVQLVGYDALPEREKNTLDIARMIREDFLQQSAFDEVDQYCSIGKQYRMLNAILTLGREQSAAIDRGLQMAQIQSIKVRPKISRMKEVREEEFQTYYDSLMSEMKEQMEDLLEV